MVFDLDLKHCIYIFLLTSSVQVLNSVFVDRHGRGNRGVYKTKIKGRLEKFGFRRETLMHKSTLMTSQYSNLQYKGKEGGLHFTTNDDTMRLRVQRQHLRIMILSLTSNF